MRCSRLLACACGTFAWMVPAEAAAGNSDAFMRNADSGGAFVRTATSPKPSAGYAPTFTGNGRLGIRVPATGQGYAGGSVPSQAELAGFYAKPSRPAKVSESPQQRANIPDWSGLSFSDAGQPFSLGRGRTTGWRQSIDLHTGTIATSATWTAPDGHVTKLTYQVLTDRASEYVGLVRLQLTPQWTGQATVTDLIDGSSAALIPPKTPRLTDPAGTGANAAARQDWVTIRAQGTGIQATLASQLVTSPNIAVPSVPVSEPSGQSVAQRLPFPVVAGQTYTITKYVGVGDSQDASDTVSAAQSTAAMAAATGWDGLLAANDAAWAKLWASRIDVLGDRTLASDVNASEFYLLSSTRDGVDWSVSPAGLSSNGYDGHIFWDAETWMFPSLLALHPTLADAMETYRFDRLGAAEQHATATGHAGARFPWESALDGTEQIPPPVAVNSEGLYEQHITADIALAQWQYYVATGDRQWLATQGWPVLSGAARFWASRAVSGTGGSYHITHVTGPDEENPNVTDEAFTDVGARTTLRDALAAAHVLGHGAPAAWARIAAGLALPVDPRLGIHPEYSGYRGQLVKQADVTLLQYPWALRMPDRVARADIDYYVPRTDPMGPSMSDAVNSIDSSSLGIAGCSSYVFTERSYQPFIRDAFDQFSETSTGGAFTFMTGIGGFLQEFLYGYSGMRFGAHAVTLAPSITGQLGGVVLRGVSWQGRVFTVAIRRGSTTVTLASGPALPLSTPVGRRVVRTGHPITVHTHRPDLVPTRDRVRCGGATAGSAAPGAPALAAVDGSAATDWQPTSVPAALTAPVRGGHTIDAAVLQWGGQWPAQPKPNVHPAPGPVIVRRATRYTLLSSADGRHWRRLAVVARTGGSTDTLHFAPVHARLVRIRIAAAAAREPPLLQELRVTG
jgi:trehalose/maltose hydrolase-like predicted phosphorylase